jgi:hypothetical protein
VSSRVRKLSRFARARTCALRLFVSALAWLVPGWSRAADASEPARVALSWKTPEAVDCASEDEIRAEVARLSEQRLVTRDPEFEIEALALAHEGSWVASVALRDEQGRILGGREVAGSYSVCRELSVPVALVVATLLDGLREQPEPTPARAAEAPPAPPERAGKIGVGVFLSGAWGLLPKLALGAGAQLELPLAWPLVLEAGASLPGKDVDAAGRGARAFSFHGGAALCPRLVGQRHALHLCGGAQAGAAVARSVGLDQSRASVKPLLWVGIEPKLVLGLTASWALQLSLGAWWVAVHPRFHWQIEGSGGHDLRTQPFALGARIRVIDFLR